MSISPKIETYGRGSGLAERLTIVPSGSWCSGPCRRCRGIDRQLYGLLSGLQQDLHRLALHLMDRRVIPDRVNYDGDNLVDGLLNFVTLGNDVSCAIIFLDLCGERSKVGQNLLPFCHMRSAFVKFSAERKC